MRTGVFLFFLFASSFLISTNHAFQIGCDVCQGVVVLVNYLVQENKTETEIEHEIAKWCTAAHISGVDANVCEGVTKEFGPEVVGIVLHITLRPIQVCQLLHYCPKSSTPKPIPPAKKLYIPERPSHLIKPARGSSNGLRILHLSDIHWDDYYTEGTNADCSDPLCCRTWNGVGKAGKWGDYNCDATQVMIEALLQQVASLNPPVDAVVWTGDNPPHDIWNETRDGQLFRLKTVTQMISKAFPTIPVFPAIGNHDTFPVDQFSRKPIDEAHYDDFSWLLNGLTTMWGHWLPNDAIETLGSGGYFTYLVTPGLRVISLNTQWSDEINFYLYLFEDQAFTELQWFVDTLTNAEQAGEKAIIIGHIAPLQGAHKEISNWVTEYLNVVNRFNDTIVGQFFGHTHDDEFQIIFDNSSVPSGIVYLAPSVTTYTNHNPTYRIYQFDSTFELVDYEQYFTNLTAANENDGPTWELEYSAKSEYNLGDLSAASWRSLVQRMETDDSVFQKWFYNYRSRVSSGDCTDSCKTSTICSFLSASPELYDSCYGARRAAL